MINIFSPYPRDFYMLRGIFSEVERNANRTEVQEFHLSLPTGVKAFPMSLMRLPEEGNVNNGGSNIHDMHFLAQPLAYRKAGKTQNKGKILFLRAILCSIKLISMTEFFNN